MNDNYLGYIYIYTRSTRERVHKSSLITTLFSEWFIACSFRVISNIHHDFHFFFMPYDVDVNVNWFARWQSFILLALDVKSTPFFFFTATRNGDRGPIRNDSCRGILNSHFFTIKNRTILRFFSSYIERRELFIASKWEEYLNIFLEIWV